MFWAVEANLIQEAEVSAGNTKIKLITAKLLKQVTAELNAYTELMVRNQIISISLVNSSCRPLLVMLTYALPFSDSTSISKIS